VIVLRDVGGWVSDDVCPALGISPKAQRVLLHRAGGCSRCARTHHDAGEAIGPAAARAP
jgi:hypothetical protein